MAVPAHAVPRREVPIRVEQVLTFGVEEEFALADAVDRVTVPRGREGVEKM